MKEKILPALIIGAAAGIATVIFLQTEEGKKLLERLESIVHETADDVTERWASLNEQLAEKILQEIWVGD